VRAAGRGRIVRRVLPGPRAGSSDGSPTAHGPSADRSPRADRVGAGPDASPLGRSARSRPATRSGADITNLRHL